MQYASESSLANEQPPCTGVLLTNLGTPDAPTPAALKRYLAEFLWDPRVVERPRWLWWLRTEAPDSRRKSCVPPVFSAPATTAAPLCR